MVIDWGGVTIVVGGIVVIGCGVIGRQWRNGRRF